MAGVKFKETAVIVRKMNEKDLEVVCAICMNSFLTSVEETLSEKGISSFTKIAAIDAFRTRMQEDNLMLVIECEREIKGVVELNEGRHIAMLFVDPGQQKKGIGRKLISSALTYARVETVTVRASLSSVPAYVKYGFKCKGEVGESAGLEYQPMEIELNNRPHGDRVSAASQPQSGA